MKNKYILILLLTLTSCKYPFKLDYMDAKPMAAIRSYVCADSLVTIDIYKTVPISQFAKADTALLSPHYTIKCNGVEVSADESIIGAGHMVLKTDAFKRGDKIELVFESEDTETAVANTVIPGTFPDYELKLWKSNDAERNLKIRYKDNPATDDWYGAVVKWRGVQGTYVGPDELQYDEVTDQSIVPPSGYDSIQIEPDAYSPISVYFNGNYLYVWSDYDEDDNEYDLSFNYKPQRYGNVIEVKDVEIQCVLFTLSEEMYKHIFAQFDRQNNPFKDAGFSSPAFTYSNVRNGLGYFCGYSVVQSDWIKDTFFEE